MSWLELQDEHLVVDYDAPDPLVDTAIWLKGTDIPVHQLLEIGSFLYGLAEMACEESVGMALRALQLIYCKLNDYSIKIVAHAQGTATATFTTTASASVVE